MLAVVTICYREVVKAYPKAGGSYVVSRDNFGPNVAQIAGAALLISYTITVAVSVAAGTDAIISAVPSLRGRRRPHVGGLRGADRLRQPARPAGGGTVLRHPHLLLHRQHGGADRRRAGPGRRSATWAMCPSAPGQMPLGHEGSGLLLGVSLFYVARAFANGGSAMTGTEAISNGVSVFREPQADNARTTLVIMSCILGHDVPRGVGPGRPGPRPAVRVGHADGGVGDRAGWSTAAARPARSCTGCLQAATALILILAANTSFTGFPFLVSFVAEDSFLPRPLTVRGHRLVFSNGIIVLAVASIALLIATRARRWRR